MSTDLNVESNLQNVFETVRGNFGRDGLPATLGYLQWLASENVFVHRDQT